MRSRLLARCAALALVATVVCTPGATGAQDAPSCLMLAWAGIDAGSSFPGTVGTLQNIDGTEVRSLDGVAGFGWSPDGASLAWSEQQLDTGTLQLGDATGSTIDRSFPEIGWGSRLVAQR